MLFLGVSECDLLIFLYLKYINFCFWIFSSVFRSVRSYCDIFCGGQLDLKGSKITLSRPVNPTLPEKDKNGKSFFLLLFILQIFKYILLTYYENS